MLSLTIRATLAVLVIGVATTAAHADVTPLVSSWNLLGGFLASPAVPEPTTLAILGVAGTALLLRRNRSK